MLSKRHSKEEPKLKVVYEGKDEEIKTIETDRSYKFFTPNSLRNNNSFDYPVAKKFKSSIRYYGVEKNLTSSILLDNTRFSTSLHTNNTYVIGRNIYDTHINIYDINTQTWNTIIVDGIHHILINGHFDMPGLINGYYFGWRIETPAILMNINIFFEKKEALRRYVIEQVSKSENKLKEIYEKRIKELENKPYN